MGVEITDFDVLQNVKEYNKDLALGLTVNFVIQSGSSLICMVYFAMNMAIGSSVNDLVFAFMAVSFGFECAVYLGQIIAFKKRDRGYFAAFHSEKFPDRTSWKTDDEAKA